MTRIKVDDRIRTLIENGVKQRHRSIFLLVGDKSRDQIVNLNYMLSKAMVKAKPTTLWCYKDKLDISSHRKKRAKDIKRKMRSGVLDPDKADSFSLFVEGGGISYCLYKDSERILGNTFSMCILQDFEALTPNLLARTIETVEGGGIILLLLHSLSSLTSLYTMVMDVHQRFRTESHSEAVGRFNERFLLSLASCKACVVMDDEFNILPISSHIRSIKPVPVKEVLLLPNLGPQGVGKTCILTSYDSEGLSEAERDLKSLKEQLTEDFPVGPLIKKCCTLDQGKAVITFLDAVLDKTLRSTIALLAARGRGKSAALGLAVAGAVAAGYSNIFITAPSPENLKTLFEFVLKGFDTLEYKEHIDYAVVKSSNSEVIMGKHSSSRGSKQVIIRINIYKQHRQTIQYILPNEREKLSQVELLVIDEAAAIPLPIVKSLLGPYLVFISSTVNGYEGTGRSLSLKLLQQLEEQSQTYKSTEGALSGRLFKKMELNESIRYAPGDPIEHWLNGLLCLDVTNYIPNINRLPPPDDCDLYYVNRDTLFSYHKDSELFLQRMMALYVASHYKNSPNDLQLMSDAPAHHLFVLLGPVDESKNHLPDILCVIQVCLEGQISRKSAMTSLSEGYQPHGDQIPWKFCEQFRDTEFPSLSGARIVRIATHPSATRLGYGSKAVELLTRYYEGLCTSISEVEEEEDVEKPHVSILEAAQKASLLEESIKPRSNLPPLLVHLRERRQERLHYVGVSFGLTQDLFRFWRKLDFFPFYIGQIPNAVTGEHTCMVIQPLKNDDVEFGDFFNRYYDEFKARFIGLLGPCYSSMHFKLAMSILEPKINYLESDQQDSNLDEVLHFFKTTPHALKLLEAYSNGLADFHLIIDLLRPLAALYFRGKIPVTLQYIQASILLLMGLQHHDISYSKDQMQLEREQIMSNLKKVMTKLYKFVYRIVSKKVESTLPRPKEYELKPHSISLDEDLNDAARQVQDQMRDRAEADGLSEEKDEDNEPPKEEASRAQVGGKRLNPEKLGCYAIVDGEVDFDSALKKADGSIPSSGLISLKSNGTSSREKKRKETSDKKRSKRGDSHSKSSKRTKA